MRCLSIFVCLFALSAAARAQAPAAQIPPSSKDSSKTSLQGSVVKEPGGEALKKAIVELIAENQEDGGNYTATSDQDGLFKIEGITPGRYRIFVERTGFLEVDVKHRRSQGRSLSLASGQEMKDVVLRMQPAAVITGRVLDEDGDPMINAEVTASERRYSSGHLRLQPAGGAQTNDLGEYRIGGLLAGKYYVTANPPVNFQSIVAEQKKSQEGSRAAEMSYVSTYYPGTTDRAQAGSIELHPGDETPVNFSLVRIRAAHVRGSVVGLATGSKAILLLRSSDSSAMFSAGEVDPEGKFDIPHVAPGHYSVIVATVLGDTPQSARSKLEVGETDIEGLRLSLASGTLIRGHIRAEPKADLRSLTLFVTLRRLEGDDDLSDGVTFNDEAGGSPTLGKVKADGSFELKEVPPGLYELEVSSASPQGKSYFVESAAVGTKETIESGLNVNGGTIPLDVTLSAGTGVAEGRVMNDKKEPVVSATVIAVPEAKYQKRSSRYYRGSTDQDGRFTIHDIRPGNYTLYAWESLEGDEYLDPEFLKRYEGQGTPLKVEKSSHLTSALKVISETSEQP
jgi:protocatechuate 3,4-dioxygenase beta subunit